MNVPLAILLLLGLSGCLREAAVCSVDSDCYQYEVCADTKCVPQTGPQEGTIPGLSRRSNGSEIALDAKGYPQIVTYFDDGDWWFSEWTGLKWQNTLVLEGTTVGALNQTQLVQERGGLLHFSYIDRDENLHIVSQTPKGWSDEVVATTDGGDPFGASFTTGPNGQLALCYVKGDFLKVRLGEAESTSHFAVRTDGKWTHLDLPSVDGGTPTFGCALGGDSSGVVRLAMTFVRPDGSVFSRTAQSFLDPIDAIKFVYEPIEIDGRIPSANSISYDSNLPSSIAFARERELDGEVLNILIGDEDWETFEILDPDGENTISEVNLYPDFNNPTRQFFTVSTSMPLNFTIGWVSNEYLSKSRIELPTDIKTVVSVPDGDGVFHLVYPNSDGGIMYRKRDPGPGVLR